MRYVVWNNEAGTATSVMQRLPDSVENLPRTEFEKLGYREMVTHRPEDYIPRFPGLSGRSEFKLEEDGRVHQYFPEADFSLKAVREHLKEMAGKDASRILFNSDWYIIRELETGKPVPEEVKELRQMIRDHVEWIANDIDNKDARSLVEYRWAYPMDTGRILINGAWVKLEGFGAQPDPNVPGPVVDPPSPVEIPREFNSWLMPLQPNVEGQPVNPPDANDIPPIIPFDERQYIDADASTSEAALHAALMIPKDGTDIRAYSPEEVEAMDPELKERLIAKEIARQTPEEHERLRQIYIKEQEEKKNA